LIFSALQNFNQISALPCYVTWELAMKNMAIVLALFLAPCPLLTPAMAETKGDTSGTAAGTNVKPGTATQKETGKTGDQPQSIQGGAPGATAKPGTEGGPAPQKKEGASD
jgi:hypothetical protein